MRNVSLAGELLLKAAERTQPSSFTSSTKQSNCRCRVRVAGRGAVRKRRKRPLCAVCAGGRSAHRCQHRVLSRTRVRPTAFSVVWRAAATGRCARSPMRVKRLVTEHGAGIGCGLWQLQVSRLLRRPPVMGRAVRGPAYYSLTNRCSATRLHKRTAVPLQAIRPLLSAIMLDRTGV